MSDTGSRPSQTRRNLEEEIVVHLGALQQLGPEYTREVATALAEQLQSLIDERIEVRLRQRDLQLQAARSERTKMLVILLSLGIPLVAVAGGIAGPDGVFWSLALLLILLWRLRVL